MYIESLSNYFLVKKTQTFAAYFILIAYILVAQT